ncbi:MAG: NUDIX domain-containing protein [Nanoarchaeota archaeon]|nr:NUDIX domain-containing protein [Nanoarchaeota archaeon]
MKLLATINDKDISGEELEFEGNYSTRTAARAVVFNSKDQIAILYSNKYNFHKLPGGGVEEGEDITKALERELKEEIGCVVEITGEVGKIIEIKNQYGQKQTSFCYIAKVTGRCESSLTKEEKEDLEIEVKWVTPTEAIQLFEKDKPKDYTGKFITKRDGILLKRVLEEKADLL